MSYNLIEEVREMGEHPSRADLPMGKTLREAAEYMEALIADKEKLSEALVNMRQAAAGFALAVREVDKDGHYPWPKLYAADALAYAVLYETGQ